MRKIDVNDSAAVVKLSMGQFGAAQFICLSEQIIDVDSHRRLDEKQGSSMIMETREATQGSASLHIPKNHVALEIQEQERK